MLNRAIHLRRQCVGELAPKPGNTVLDVGCGTGLSFAALENGVGSEGRIIGIDQSLEQHAKARALAAQNGWQDVTLLSSAVEDARIPLIATNH